MCRDNSDVILYFLWRFVGKLSDVHYTAQWDYVVKKPKNMTSLTVFMYVFCACALCCLFYVCVYCVCVVFVFCCVFVYCVCTCVCASVFLTNIKKQTSYRKSVLLLTSLETPASLCHAQQTSAWTRKLFPSPVYAQWSGSFLRSSNWHDWRTLAWKLKFFS